MFLPWLPPFKEVKMFKAFFLVLLFFPFIGYADSQPTLLGGGGADCKLWQMCNDSTNGVCENGSADEVVFGPKRKTKMAFYSTRSTATAYACDLYTNDQGFDASTGNGYKFNNAQITETQEHISYEGVFHSVWVDCAGIVGGNVIITVLACTD